MYQVPTHYGFGDTAQDKIFFSNSRTLRHKKVTIMMQTNHDTAWTSPKMPTCDENSIRDARTPQPREIFLIP